MGKDDSLQQPISWNTIGYRDFLTATVFQEHGVQVNCQWQDAPKAKDRGMGWGLFYMSHYLLPLYTQHVLDGIFSLAFTWGRITSAQDVHSNNTFTVEAMTTAYQIDLKGPSLVTLPRPEPELNSDAPSPHWTKYGSMIVTWAFISNKAMKFYVPPFQGLQKIPLGRKTVAPPLRIFLLKTTQIWVKGKEGLGDERHRHRLVSVLPKLCTKQQDHHCPYIHHFSFKDLLI